MRYIIITLSVLLMLAGISAGAGPKISENGNKHNFSSSNVGVTFRASDSDPRGKQICIFCHTPHQASSEGPLWNRNASASTFKHFSSATLAIDDAALKDAADYGQPTGSSRLCLSCHDGVTAIGAVFSTPGNIPMFNGKDKIGYETYSSHHPVSFRYNQAVRDLLRGTPYSKALHDLPPTSIDPNVKLDKQERMQCTTCHDPHQNKATDPDNPTTPFWSTTTYESACLSCHNFSGSPVDYPYPWKP
jgi:hypothetical protein